MYTFVDHVDMAPWQNLGVEDIWQLLFLKNSLPKLLEHTFFLFLLQKYGVV